MLVETIEIDNIHSLFQCYLNPLNKENLLQNKVFRGVSNSDYQLIPSALRLENKDIVYGRSTEKDTVLSELEMLQLMSEYRLLLEFYKKSKDKGLRIHYNEELEKYLYHKLFDKHSKNMIKEIDEKVTKFHDSLDTQTLHLAAIAQHYGIPTRLLDWTRNPLTALYFACIGAIKKKKEDMPKSIAVWILDCFVLDCAKLKNENVKVELIWPETHYNYNLRAQEGVFTYIRRDFCYLKEIFEYDNEILSVFGEPSCIKFDDSYSFTDTVNSYKKIFQKIEELDKNIKLQQIEKYLIDRTPLDKYLIQFSYPDLKKPILYQLKISTELIHDIYKYIKGYNNTASKLFPNYEGVCKEILEDSLFNDRSK